MIEERRKFIKELRSIAPVYSLEELLAQKAKEYEEPACTIVPPSEEELKAEKANEACKNAIMEKKDEASKRFLLIDSIEDWQKLTNTMLDIGALKEAASHIKNPGTILGTLTRFESAVRRNFAKPPESFEKDFSEKTAWKIIQLLGKYLSNLLSYLERNLKSPDVARLATCLDTYFATLCIDKHRVNPWSSAEEWMALEMVEGAIVTTNTEEKEKNGTISEIYIQPRVIHFMNAFAELTQQYFLGQCCVYKLKE